MRFWDDYVLNDPDGDVYEAIIEALMASALPVNEKERLKNFFLDPLPDPLPCGERGTELLDPLPDPLPSGERGTCPLLCPDTGPSPHYPLTFLHPHARPLFPAP